MPFENEMLLLEVPGDVLLEVIEKISKRGSSMIWPVTFDQTKEGPINIQLNDQAISPTKNYVMAISDYLANGGSGFAMLKSVKRLEVSPVKLRDIIVKEIREKTERGESIHVSIAHHIQVIE
jgi:2',3'-cyclic-nucleotide 2'-phosphodiesterase (5'-nucleotidase family)